jgi:hypothetical protein
LPATGAAISPPLPAFSMTTVTAICGSSAGAKPVNHAWDCALIEALMLQW